MGGFLGLRYESLPFLFKLYYASSTKKELKALFEEIQIMEFSALAVLNEEKKK